MLKTLLTFFVCFFLKQAFSQTNVNKDSLYYFYFTGDYEKALNFGIKQLDEAKFAGDTTLFYSEALYDLAIVNTDMGNYDTAQFFCTQAKKIQEKLKYNESNIYANTLTAFGNLYALIGRYKEAEDMLNTSNNIFTKLNLKNNDYAELLNTFGYLYQVTAKFEKSIEHFKASLKLREAILGKTHTKYILTFGNLGVSYFIQGDYLTAENIFLNALQLIRKSATPNKTDLAYMLSYLSAVYLRLGNTNAAYPYVKESIELMRQTVGEASPDFAASLNNLGHCSLGFGKISEADSLYKESIKVIQKSVGNQHPTYAAKLTNYAVFALACGNIDTSLSYFNKALNIVKKKSGEEDMAHAYALRYIGRAYFKKGMIDTAYAIYSKSLNIFEKFLGKEHPDYINLAGFYIDAMYKANKFADAENFISRAVETQKKQLINKLDFLTTQDLIKYLLSAEYILETPYSFISKFKESALTGTMFNNTVLLKGIVAANYANLVKYLENSLSDTLISNKWYLYKKTKQQINKLITQSKEKKAEVLDSLELAVFTLEKDLLKSSLQFRDIKWRLDANWQNIKQSLLPSEAAIEFVEYNVNNPKGFVTHYGVFVLRNQSTIPVFIQLGTKSEIALALSKFSYKSKPAINLTTQISNKNVYELVWKPIEKHLANVKTIYFSPDGLLHQIAFNALSNLKNKMLIEQYKLVQLTSTRELVERDTLITFPQNAVLFGGVNYTKQVNDTLAKPSIDIYKYVYQQNHRGLADTFSYLPGTLAEVNTIENKLKFNGTATIKYTGQNASESNFRRSCNEIVPQIIHVATHGFALPDTTTAAGVNTAFTNSSNPLLRTGLVMAGGNIGWKGNSKYNEDDGILTGMEIANMQLPQVQLVVLSACETANGEIKGSEGVFSLQRAFKLAGVKYIMASLWQLPDLQTKEFMANFYSAWTKLKNIQEAFYQTQLTMKKKYSPYYWAGFVLIK